VGVPNEGPGKNNQEEGAHRRIVVPFVPKCVGFSPAASVPEQ
jgi:hypothetical protein